MNQNNLPDHPLSDQLHISAAELATRLAFLSFTRVDEENLREIAAILRADVEPVIDEFYRHLHQFEELRDIFSDPALLARLKESQRAYLLSFESASFGVEFAERRLRIGLVHEQIGLAQKWYLGAYRLLSELVSRRLTERYATDGRRLAALILTLSKILRLDEIFVVEAYYHMSTQRLEQSVKKAQEARRQIELLSRLDPLTRIQNRRSLMEELEKELQRSRRYQRHMALLFLDIDHFKSINDRFGHAFGDRVLQRITQVASHPPPGYLRPLWGRGIRHRPGGMRSGHGPRDRKANPSDHGAHFIRIGQSGGSGHRQHRHRAEDSRHGKDRRPHRTG